MVAAGFRGGTAAQGSVEVITAVVIGPVGLFRAVDAVAGGVDGVELLPVTLGGQGFHEFFAPLLGAGDAAVVGHVHDEAAHVLNAAGDGRGGRRLLLKFRAADVQVQHGVGIIGGEGFTHVLQQFRPLPIALVAGRPAAEVVGVRLDDDDRVAAADDFAHAVNPAPVGGAALVAAGGVGTAVPVRNAVDGDDGCLAGAVGAAHQAGQGAVFVFANAVKPHGGGRRRDLVIELFQIAVLFVLCGPVGVGFRPEIEGLAVGRRLGFAINGRRRLRHGE